MSGLLRNVASVLLAALCFAAPLRAADPAISFTGLVVWLPSGFVDQSGGKVTVWKNGLGTGANNANGGVSPASLPTLVPNSLNGQAAVRFDGSQQLYFGNVPLTSWTIFVVGRNNNPGESFGLILGPGDNTNNQFRYENGTQMLVYGGANGMGAITKTVGNTRVFHVLSTRYNASTRLHEVFRDGVLKGPTNSFTSLGTWNLGRVGSWYSSCGSCYLKGDLVEILVYNRALNEAERAQVNAYLGSKFALPSS
jgi:hypothetical protein